MKTLLALIVAPVAIPLVALAYSLHMYGLIRWTRQRDRYLKSTQIGWG